MTIAEMHYHVDQGLQKVASFVYGNFEPEEMDAFINKMILRFIKDRFDKSDQAELGFEATQKRLDDIRVIIELSTNNLSGFQEGDGTVLSLPLDYMFYIPGFATIGYDVCNRVLSETLTDEVPLRLVSHDVIYKAQRDPYRKSTPETGCLTTITGNVIKVYGGKRFILKGVTYNYIRKPLKVELSSYTDCELAEHTHDEIVDLTIQHILEVIESPRYQTNSAQANKTE